MIEPILKSSWERSREHVVLDRDTSASLLAPYSKNAVATCTLLTDGCANTNYKIQFSDGTTVVLRLYLRDPSALPREIGIHKLVKDLLPTPEFLYSDSSCSQFPHPYAVMQWMDGQLMREMIFQNDDTVISELMHDAGAYLGMLRALKLPYGGFFTEDMQIRAFTDEEEYETYMMQLLQDKVVAHSLGKNLQNDLQQLISQCCYLLPQMNEANLTHADYDPSNMLVVCENGKWKISAILDWEFTFSGSYLFDIGTMLRYSHKLPAIYETSFVRGIQEIGTPLPSDWKKQAKLLDLICLLQLLQLNPADARPYLNRDVLRLISHTVNNFTKIT